MNTMTDDQISQSVAIIGMSGRFPGAESISEFWQNLLDETCSLEMLRDDALRASGVPDEIICSPRCIKRAGVLHNSDMFDAPFFTYSRREAELIDPQQRLFLECAWEAFEDAGYTPESARGSVGVFGGAGMNYYFIKNILSRHKRFEEIVDFLTFIGSEKDYLCSRVSYKLGLTGPSFSINSACSTSLVAIQVGYQSLLTGQCDYALCGGVSLQSPRDRASLYNEGEIFSPQGICRTFDKKADGIVFGEGVGIVMLKRTEDALRDRDHIYAVIRSAVVNNDGSAKSGYTAPGFESQSDLIALAQEVAGVVPDEIAFIEAHGTATRLGDAIEVGALTKAFRRHSNRKRFCALGSVKTNIGHLDTAAGVTGLIKTALALKNRVLPASINFIEENPELELGNSPFYVAKEKVFWENHDVPLIAGLSSFGMGGTNAHAILQEPPARQLSIKARRFYLIPFSAHSENALSRTRERLQHYLIQNDNLPIQDVAFTLQTGRYAFEARSFAVCSATAELISILGNTATAAQKSPATLSSQPVIFAFSGQGAQYPGMGRQLYNSEKIVRDLLDQARTIMQSETGEDLFSFLFPADTESVTAAQTLSSTVYTQPALFALEYAIARLFISFGIKPAACIGHSIGEYTAAAIAGVFTFEQGMRIVLQRGKIMDAMQRGSMAFVALTEKELQSHISGNLVIALVNAPSSCVVAGPTDEVSSFIETMKRNSVRCGLLQTSHAFHSPMMDEAARQLKEYLDSVTLSKPALPFISNVSGTWITSDQCTSSRYWADHLRKTIRFSDGITELLNKNYRLFLEIGPGSTLSTLISMHTPETGQIVTVQSLHHGKQQTVDEAFFTSAIGELWSAGVTIDWSVFYPLALPNKIPLPTYPFERQRYWIEYSDSGHAIKTDQTDDLGDLTSPNDLTTNKKQKAPSIFDFPNDTSAETSIELILTDIWKRCLGIESLGISANFFELGGDSVLSVNIFNEIYKKFNIRLSISILMKYKTVQALSEYLAKLVGHTEQKPQGQPGKKTLTTGKKFTAEWNTVIPIQTSGNLPPFFCVSGLGGNPMELNCLAAALEKNQPFYLLQHRGVDGVLKPHDTIEEMASEFIKDIRRIQPAGPYYIGGYSFGGIAAYDMVQQLLKHGDSIAGLILLDTANPQLVKWTFREYVGTHITNILKKGPGYLVNRGIAFATSRIRRRMARSVKRDTFSLRNDLVTDYNIKASLAYKPAPINTSVLLVQCALQIDPADGIGFPHREVNGWGQLIATKNLKIRVMQTNHLAMITAPFAAETALLITEGLETFRQNYKKQTLTV